MPSKLKTTILSLLICLTSFAALADETMNSLHSLQTKIKVLVFTMKDPAKVNFQRLQILVSQKAKLELEMKQILESEKRDPATDAIHDEAYDKTDDLMIGLTAISILRMNPDGNSVKETSCDEARSLLRVLSRTGNRTAANPDQLPFAEVIELMCSQKAKI